ncbi:branched-chain amino acid ABC transporter permease [Bradyrhizobium valentinum]|uniref:branched-chain amino acid ABC transporter permease n=1 Tax=Bradyrhizobium valentinum TaxID=1518501 RepID=UPI000B29BEA1
MTTSMDWTRLISRDRPGSRLLIILLIAIIAVLLVAPFALTGAKAISICVKIMIFAVLVASFDLLLGYTGIVSFAHTVFFGIGAYGVGIAIIRLGASWTSLAVGASAAIVVSVLLALVIGLFSLRVRAIFFSMITLALSAAAQTLATQLSNLTGGEDGIIFRLPPALMPSFRLLDTKIFGLTIDGKVVCYYFIFAMSVTFVLALLRIVNSPFGRVLLAIRDNEFRAEAIGYPVFVFRTLSNVVAAVFACLAGVMLSLWLRYTGPDASLSFEIMLDILMIVIIGGVGTIYGSIVGAVAFLVAQGYLQDLLKGASAALGSLPGIGKVLSPDRWMLWLGLLFILAVYYFPTGIVGVLRRPARRLDSSSKPSAKERLSIVYRWMGRAR